MSKLSAQSTKLQPNESTSPKLGSSPVTSLKTTPQLTKTTFERELNRYVPPGKRWRAEARGHYHLPYVYDKHHRRADWLANGARENVKSWSDLRGGCVGVQGEVIRLMDVHMAFEVHFYYTFRFSFLCKSSLMIFFSATAAAEACLHELLVLASKFGEVGSRTSSMER